MTSGESPATTGHLWIQLRDDPLPHLYRLIMKLYHGTSARVGRLAVTEGLKTRKSTKAKTNWDTAPSRYDAIYLSVAYAPYFAMNTDNPNDEIAIVEIDSEMLFGGLLLPDEDAIEQSNRATNAADGCPLDWNIMKRTAHYRKNLHKYNSGQWKDSLKLLGNCAYRGNIPTRAITRVAIMDIRDNLHWAHTCLDPMISLANFSIMGDKYRLLNSLPFGGEVTEEPDYEKNIRQQLITMNPEHGKMYRNVWDIAREFDRSKVEIIKP